jgi:hypothetical protein
LSPGDIVTGILWTFDGGSLGGTPVPETLSRYLDHLGGLVEQAEQLLAAAC